MNKSILSIYVLLVFFAASCGTSREKQGELVVSTDVLDSLVESASEVRFYFYEEKNEYPDAMVEMYSPLGNQKFKPGKVPFEFNIKNYPFDAGLSGFQLKMVLNGNDPVGYNSPIFQKELNQGTYRAVAYLVDEEGLALKEFGNYVDRDFMVGETRAFPYQAEPYVIMNLPHNDQRYAQGEEITVDFLLLGGDMNKDRLNVILEVDSMRYPMEQVSPVRVSGLGPGAYSISLHLVKKDGKELDGPFSSVRRRITIE
ncbi:hypothetical protein [Cecembia lonarensis]|uniref:Uncharacterized protein n=1 Tax=Cecembia lonarensis (strain CCUG 58316 / KCTC 22772 / LW9) TaxID=1225176 RepID=K1L2Q7_CECL9|nr:hypothetical protein [Cecembia lonarensis]EKB49096.1 hypothetical protein B879_02283 [Cecembia lonarensis LW9]